MTCATGWQSASYIAVVATRGFELSPVQPHAFDPRVVAVDITVRRATIRLVGVYAPTNGMTAESSERRNRFQGQLLDHLTEISRPALCVAGDLNVVEPGHRPHLPAFEPHDYAFYNGLLDLGLQDAYRALNPGENDHSWINAQYGSQRLDHTLIGKGAGLIATCAYDHTPRQEGLTDHAALKTVIRLHPTSAGQ